MLDDHKGSVQAARRHLGSCRFRLAGSLGAALFSRLCANRISSVDPGSTRPGKPAVGTSPRGWLSPYETTVARASRPWGPAGQDARATAHGQDARATTHGQNAHATQASAAGKRKLLVSTDRLLAYDALGRTHWWLTSKYAVLRDVVRTQIPRGADLDPMLDVGCAGGAFLAVLGDLACPRFGVDENPEVLKRCKREAVWVAAADALHLPYKDEAFSFVSAVDLIEHLPDDEAAVGEFHRVLRPGGWLLLCVPAFQTLFGKHDELFGHLRRYTRGQLRRVANGAGFSVRKATYIQPFFFPLLWVKRRWFPGKDPLVGDFSRPNPALNRALHAVLAAERFVIRHAGFPIGATLILLAQKGSDSRG